VTQTVADGVSFIGSRLATGTAAAPYRAWVARTFKPALDELTWTMAPGEADDRAELRAALIGLVAGTGHDPDARARARALVTRYLQKPESLGATLAETLLPIAAEDGDQALYDTLLAKRAAAKAPEDRDRFLLALARFTNPALVKRTVDLALSEDVRTQDTATLLAIALSGAAGQDLTWPLVRERWSAVMSHIDASFGPAVVVSALGSFCSMEVAADLDQFFKTHDPKGAARTVQQSIERVKSCAALKADQGPKLTAWLANSK
jgi:aminopeptidase N